MSADVDKANVDFWETLCGSPFARALGIKDFTLESLQRFDEAYFDYYSYLLRHVDLASLSGKKVLEVGLGYGSLGQKIAESGAEYLGLDIAEAPVRLMNERLRLVGLGGLALQGSLLRSAIRAESLDYVVSIGCFHHTGDIRGCIDETYRILKPGGVAVIMVYNLFSYRQWWKWPKQTFQSAVRWLTSSDRIVEGTEAQRIAYDGTDAFGRSAPSTVFLSGKQLRKMFAKYSSVAVRKENCHDLAYSRYLVPPPKEGKYAARLINLRVEVFVPRELTLSWLGRALGLDLYVRAIK
jgi:SAM-dependent methyltransferase